MLPPENEDHVIEISLKHIVIGFSGLLTGVFIAGSGLLLVKEHLRYKRQRMYVESLGLIMHTLTKERNDLGSKS